MEKFFVSRPVFAVALALAIVLIGVVSILNLAIEQYPDVTPPVVEVSATYPGADAETVNDAVATPIAQSVMGVDDLLYMQSTSANDGSMSLQVTFDIGSDPDLDAIFTQNRVAEASSTLPASVVRQGVTTQKTMSGFLLVYALYSDGRYDDEFLSNYAYIHLQNELLKIGGVGKVSIMGAGEYAMRVWLKPDLLDYYDLTVAEVSQAISTQGGIYPAGKFGAEPAPEGTAFTYTVTMPAQLSTAKEFSRIVLKTTDTGEQVLLEDVAEVEFGSQSYASVSAFDGKPSALVVVYQQPGSNAVEVGEAVGAAMKRLSAKFYDGMAYETVVDATQSIRAGIRDIFRTLLIALVLVIVIIYLFLQDWRATLIPLIAIPVSLIGAFALFPLLGFSINIISLLGMVLAIGLVVDDAIVVVEAVQVNLAAGMTPRRATVEAMRNVASPIVATTVVLLAVFVPVSFTGGITGLLFRQFSITIALSVVLSAFNALSLSPALCVLLLRPRKEPDHGFFFRFNRWFAQRMKGYDARTTALLKHTGRIVLFVVLFLGVIAVSWRFVPKGFLPEEDQGYVMVAVETPEASSLQTTRAAMEHVEAVASARPEVRSASYAAGFNMLAGIASPSSGILFLSLTDYDKRKLSAMELAQLLTDELYVAVPEAEAFAFIPPSIPGLGVASGVSVEVQDLAGQGARYLETESDKLMAALRKHPEIASVTTQYNGGIPQRHLDIDREHALIQGVDLADLYAQIASLLGGEYINNFSRFGKLYQTYLQAGPDYRTGPGSLSGYFIDGRNGESVPLADFITVRDTVGAEFVTQFDLERSISLTVTPAAKSSSGTVMEIIEREAAAILPEDVGLAWSGISYQERNSSRSGGWVYLLALAFVFLALSALYNSWSMPLAILLSVPLAVAGAMASVWAVHLWDALLVNDIYLQISLVMLIGLAAKNAILVAEYADRMFFEQGLSLSEAAMGAARQRVRPILMTAFAFILGVLPLVFAHGVYATARHVMGVALVGGMTVATLAGIFLYPALYYLIGRIFGFEKKRERLKREANL